MVKIVKLRVLMSQESKLRTCECTFYRIRHIKTERGEGMDDDSGAVLGELFQRLGMPLYKCKAKCDLRCKILGAIYLRGTPNSFTKKFSLLL